MRQEVGIRFPVYSAFRTVLIMQIRCACVLLLYSTLKKLVYEYLLLFAVT